MQKKNEIWNQWNEKSIEINSCQIEKIISIYSVFVCIFFCLSTFGNWQLCICLKTIVSIKNHLRNIKNNVNSLTFFALFYIDCFDLFIPNLPSIMDKQKRYKQLLWKHFSQYLAFRHSEIEYLCCLWYMTRAAKNILCCCQIRHQKKKPVNQRQNKKFKQKIEN